MLKTSSDDEAMMTFMVAELPHPWQYPALDRMLDYLVNYELRAARWVSARQMQNIKLTELQPVLVTPVELGYEKGKFVKGGIGVAQE